MSSISLMAQFFYGKQTWSAGTNELLYQEVLTSKFTFTITSWDYVH